MQFFPFRELALNTPGSTIDGHHRAHEINKISTGIRGKQLDHETLHSSERCYDHMTLPSLTGAPFTGTSFERAYRPGLSRVVPGVPSGRGSVC